MKFIAIATIAFLAVSAAPATDYTPTSTEEPVAVTPCETTDSATLPSAEDTYETAAPEEAYELTPDEEEAPEEEAKDADEVTYETDKEIKDADEVTYETEGSEEVVYETEEETLPESEVEAPCPTEEVISDEVAYLPETTDARAESDETEAETEETDDFALEAPASLTSGSATLAASILAVTSVFLF